MSSGSSPTTYIPEPATPTITRSVTSPRDYQYAADVMDKLEAERKDIQERTLSELTARRSELGAKEDKSYRESLATDEPNYTKGLDPDQLNTIASKVYSGGATAALQDLASRASREYTPVAGSNRSSREYVPVAGANPGLYRGVAQGVNIYEQSGDYGVGFGQGDLRRALQEGYTEESIKDYLNNYYQGSIGSAAAEQLGISPRTSNLSRTQPTQTQKEYAGEAGGVNIFQPDAYGVGFGAGDLRRAQEAGYSSESIKKFLQGKDIQIGEKARAALGM